MTDSPPPAAVQLLPVRQTIVASYRAVLGRPAAFARALALPYLLAVVIAYGWSLVPDQAFSGAAILAFCIGLIPYTLFGVAWHRLTLLGSEDGYPSTFSARKRQHLIFYAYSLAAALIYILPLAAISLLGGTGSQELSRIAFDAMGTLGVKIFEVLCLIVVLSLAYVLLPYFLARLSFVFPAASVDERYFFRHSWRHTRGQGLRLFIVMVAAGLPTSFVFFKLMVVGPTFGFGLIPAPDLGGDSGRGALGFAVYLFLRPLFNFVPLALVGSAVSIAFRTCTGWAPPAAASTR